MNQCFPRKVNGRLSPRRGGQLPILGPVALTTARHNDALPALDWYLMPEAFSAPLVDAAIREYGLGPAAVVLDPFSGTGTTALLAKPVIADHPLNDADAACDVAENEPHSAQTTARIDR